MERIFQEDPNLLDNLQLNVDRGLSYVEISELLKEKFSHIDKGLSSRSVRRYCCSKKISKRKGQELDTIVLQSVSEVGTSYGRKIMKGHLFSKGLNVSEARVSSSLQRVCPDGFQRRRTNTVNRTNPIRYSAKYFGHKLHVNQNEKLAAYGVTHVVSLLGSVDHGREFYLLLYFQDKLRRTFGNPDITPYVQSKSTDNLIIERIWPEVNLRVNYPIKQKLIEMEDNGYIDMEIPSTKFCVSFIAINVASIGMQRFVDAWNCHPVTGGGSPNDKALQRVGVTPIPLQTLPSGDMARQEYNQQGGEISAFGLFGRDPLRERTDLVQQRDAL